MGDYLPWDFPGGVPSYPPQSGGTFEESPQGSEVANQIDSRFQELKYNVRLRANTELCWDTSTSSGPAGTGRSRYGSARAFHNNVQPAALTSSDALGSTALDAGRLWVKPNGSDGIGGNDDDYTLFAYNGSAWKPVVALGAVGAGLSNNDVWMYRTTLVGWERSTPFDAVVDSATNTTANVAIDNAAVHNITLAGGSDASGSPAVTVPDAGTYMIQVVGNVDWQMPAGTGNVVYLGLKENGTVVRVYKVRCQTLDGGSFSINYIKDAPTLSTTYIYTLETQAGVAGAVFNPTGGGFAIGTTGNTATNLQVTLMSKRGLTGF